MRPIRKYQEGGDVRSLLNRLAAQSKPLPAFQLQPAVSESTMTRRPDELQQQLSAGQAMDFAGMLRDMQRAKEREEFEAVMGKGYPMDSGSIESVTPMKFFTPIGDVEDIASGLQMAGRGAMEGDLGKIAGGAGLSLAAGAMAFLPGNLSMVRSYAQSVNNPMLDRIFKGIGEGKDENVQDLLKNVGTDYTQREIKGTVDDIDDILRLSFDDPEILSLTNTERLALEDIKEFYTEGSMSRTADLPDMGDSEGFFEELPDDLLGLKKEVQVFGPNEVSVSYYDPDPRARTSDQIELNTGTVAEKVPGLAGEYGDRTVHSMNIDLTNAKSKPNQTTADQKAQYDALNKVFGVIKKGDLIGVPRSGSLSTDSYPMILRQIQKGNRYQNLSEAAKEGTKERGVKIIDKVSIDEAVDYRTLNDMGQFSNFFRLPKQDFDRVRTDGMLDGTGTSRAQGFKSKKEANDYLQNIKEKYIDPRLKEIGLPPARMEQDPRIPGSVRILYPHPVVEKLRLGGKIGLKKNRKNGLIAKKR